MKITKNCVVVLCYEVKVDGVTVDSMTEARPLDYIHGTNMLLPRFEQELEGHEEGYEFAFSANPDEGYGAYDNEKVVEIPKTAFMVDGKVHEEILKLGNFIPMYNGAGEIVHGKVTEVKEDSVMMDFNHPMADKVLNFTGKVLSVREASEKELTEGLHGEYLPHQCSGGCGGCGEGGCKCGGEGEGGCKCGGEGEGCGCGCN